MTPAVCGPRVTPLFAPAEWRPSEPARCPVEVCRAGSPGPASEVQVKWTLWVIAVTAALVGGPCSYGLSSVSAQKPFLRRSPPTRCRKPPPSSRPAEVPGLRSEMLSHTGSFSAPSSPRDAGVCVPGRWGRPRRALLQPSPADGVCPRACRGDACHVVGECVRPHCCSL